MGGAAWKLFGLLAPKPYPRSSLATSARNLARTMAFFLTLPSNSSMQFYPSNTPSHYFTKLPQDMNLTGDYEVGLAEIQFSNTYNNVEEEDCVIKYKEKTKTIVVPTGPNTEESMAVAVADPTIITIPAGLYRSNEYFVQVLNMLVKRKVGTQENGSPKVKFYYNPASKKASIRVYQENSVLELSERLQEILGLIGENAPPLHGSGYFEGLRMLDLNEHFKSLYVYCDVVSPFSYRSHINDGHGTTDVIHRRKYDPHASFSS